MAEDDWDGWALMTKRMGARVQIVGDDVFVTNSERLRRGIDAGVANSILIKVNQIGTLTEAARANQLARNAGWAVIVSARSGETEDNRLADLAVGWGADCIKILLYYTPFDSAEINDVKHAWVERIGAECVAADAPFFLEFVGYEEGADEKGLEFAKKKPEVVTRSMEEFSKPQYAVDVLKVEVPVTMAFVKGTRSCKGDSAYTREEAKDHFRKAAAFGVRERRDQRTLCGKGFAQCDSNQWTSWPCTCAATIRSRGPVDGAALPIAVLKVTLRQ
jgi:hypothetical protein